MPADVEPAIQHLVTAWVVLLGAVVGSFLNVVIARVPAGLSVVRPRSRCPRCGAAIAWYDNVPVLSWLVLRARCRGCRGPISARYPLVEALGAALAWLAFARHGLSAAAAAEFAFAAVLLALALIDLDTWLLPNALTWPLIAFGLAMGALGLSAAPSWQSAALGAAAGFAAFGAVAVLGEKVFHKEAMGFGDVWVLAALGAWQGLAALLPLVLLASLQGSVVGLALIALGKSQAGPPEPATPTATPTDPDVDADWVPPRHAVPFGPFLVLGALEWLYLSGALARLVPALSLFR